VVTTSHCGSAPYRR